MSGLTSLQTQITLAAKDGTAISRILEEHAVRGVDLDISECLVDPLELALDLRTADCRLVGSCCLEHRTGNPTTGVMCWRDL